MMMNQYYVLTINPQAPYDWDKCVLRHPITGERPDLTALIAKAVGDRSGAYLISVNVEVQVLETSAQPEVRAKSTSANASAARPQLVAS